MAVSGSDISVVPRKFFLYITRCNQRTKPGVPIGSRWISPERPFTVSGLSTSRTAYVCQSARAPTLVNAGRKKPPLYDPRDNCSRNTAPLRHFARALEAVDPDEPRRVAEAVKSLDSVMRSHFGHPR